MPMDPTIPKDMEEIMSLLAGVAPSSSNVRHVLDRRYCFGDAQIPSKTLQLLKQRFGDEHHGLNQDSDETLSYFLGLPPTKDMQDVTDRLLHRDSPSHAIDVLDQQQRSSSKDVVCHTKPTEDIPQSEEEIKGVLGLETASPRPSPSPPQFSTPEYDVVSLALCRAREAAESYGTYLYHATHSNSRAGSSAEDRATKSDKQSEPTTAASRRVNTSQATSMPEELLGAQMRRRAMDV